MTRPSIVRLLLRCRPSAIAGFVIAVIIDSINGMFRRWSWSDRTQKRCEVASPFRAHSDATTTISMIARVVNVLASSYCAAPRLIFWRVCHAMCAKPVPCVRILVASARHDSPVYKMLSANGLHRPAGARTVTERVAPKNDREDGHSPEYVAEIDCGSRSSRQQSALSDCFFASEATAGSSRAAAERSRAHHDNASAIAQARRPRIAVENERVLHDQATEAGSNSKRDGSAWHYTNYSRKVA